MGNKQSTPNIPESDYPITRASQTLAETDEEDVSPPFGLEQNIHTDITKSVYDDLPNKKSATTLYRTLSKSNEQLKTVSRGSKVKVGEDEYHSAITIFSKQDDHTTSSQKLNFTLPGISPSGTKSTSTSSSKLSKCDRRTQTFSETSEFESCDDNIGLSTTEGDSNHAMSDSYFSCVSSVSTETGYMLNLLKTKKIKTDDLQNIPKFCVTKSKTIECTRYKMHEDSVDLAKNISDSCPSKIPSTNVSLKVNYNPTLLKQLSKENTRISEGSWKDTRETYYYRCPLCTNVKFTLLKSYKHHMYYHSKPTRKCPYCRKVYRLNCHVKRHINLVHRDKT